MTHPKLLLVIALVVLGLASPSGASIIIFGTHNTHSVIPGGDITDVRLEVDLTVSGSVATFSFTNVSTGLETTAVIAEIVIDTYDDDTATSLLTNGLVLTNTVDVAFDLSASNGLPNVGSLTTDPVPLAELNADPPPTQKGLNVGETLLVQFDTTLPDGSDIIDYLIAFNGGSDTFIAALGFHAIKSSTVDGKSLTGIVNPGSGGAGQVPEPGTLALCALGAAGLVVRRKL